MNHGSFVVILLVKGVIKLNAKYHVFTGFFKLHLLYLTIGKKNVKMSN